MEDPGSQEILLEFILLIVVLLVASKERGKERV